MRAVERLAIRTEGQAARMGAAIDLLHESTGFEVDNADPSVLMADDDILAVWVQDGPRWSERRGEQGDDPGTPVDPGERTSVVAVKNLGLIRAQGGGYAVSIGGISCAVDGFFLNEIPDPRFAGAARGDGVAAVG